MAARVVDIETNGLNPDTIWVACVNDRENIQTLKDPKSLRRALAPEDTVIGHNFFGFDAPVLQELWDLEIPKENIVDTLVLSRLANPSREGGHSMEDWGLKLGVPKVEHEDWTQWSPEMDHRCEQDTDLNWRIYDALQRELKGFSEESILLEHQVAPIIAKQIKRGWLLDQEKCFVLLAELKQRKMEVEDEVHQRFKPLATQGKEITPKRKADGGLSKVGLNFLGSEWELCVGPCTVVHFPDFNLGSRQQIGRYLQWFGWVPHAFTETGQVKVDESILENVQGIPEAELIGEYLMLQKRVAMVQSWLDAVGPDGRVHGFVNSNGAVTGRMTHSDPNVAQVVASRAPWGFECRSCWTVPTEYSLVGVDADGLELRMLAHYMNDPDYIDIVVSGSKELGTDAHTMNMKAAGLSTRDQAKTFIYAFLYGAGDAKIGSIIGGTKKDGALLKAKFLRNTPALRDLRERVLRAAQRGWLKGLDGRKIMVRSPHAALNTLLQGAGAIVMKRALVVCDEYATRNKWDYAFVGNIHDEMQTEVWTPHAKPYGIIAASSIEAAGLYYELRCPLAATYSIGKTWAETH